MANEENLIPLGKGNRSEKEEREMRQRGGQRSGETRRRKKSMREATKLLMELPASSKNVKLFEKMGIDAEDATNQMTVLVAIMQKAIAGDVQAAGFLRDTMGENPVVQQRQSEARQKKKAAEDQLAFERERFEYQKSRDAGENLEYEYMEDVEAEIYGGGGAAEGSGSSGGNSGSQEGSPAATDGTET